MSVMERRKFIGSAGLAGILATGLAPAAHANQAIRWRLVSSFPKTLDITYGGALVFAREVKEMSGGKIDISVHAAEELMPAFNVLDGVQRGVVECAHTAPHYFIAKDESFALDSAIPFGLNSRGMTAWMRHGNGLALLREFYKGYGIVNFPLGNTGAQMGGWYRKPIRSLADVKGLRMRIAHVGGLVLQRLGGVPVSIAGGDIYKALERGEIAAAEWVGPYDDLKLGLHKLCKYYAYPSWWEGGTQLSLYVNQRAYESLTAENKAIVEAAAAVAHLDMQAQFDARNPPALKELVATGTQLVPLPKTVLDAAYKAAQDLYAELAGRNQNWRKIHASYAAFLKEQSWAWGYAEMSFSSYMHQRALEQLKRSKAKQSALAPRR
jgi:TRAP-type mannitol/chloroaromatic compound transport system substrate-binding protein